MKKFLSLLLVSVSLGFAGMVKANPSPFGLTLESSTVADMQAKYTSSHMGVNRYSHGPMYELSPGELGVDGITSATAIFDQNNKLVGVLTSLSKHRFDSLYSLMRGKYSVESQQMPFVGNKRVVMRDGNTQITLDAPHMSFEMEMNYITDSFRLRFENEQRREQEDKRRGEAGNL